MVKIVFIDGPDVSGKTTLVKKLLDNPDFNFKELVFDKGLGGLLRINKEEQFEILRSLLPNLNPVYIYIMDRCYLSNMVYDGISGEDIEPSLEFRDWCKDYVDSIEIMLDRPYIKTDFEDDLVTIDKITFNEIIDEYRILGSVDIINNPELEEEIFDMLYKWQYQGENRQSCLEVWHMDEREEITW